jgi:hypothetical protein
MNRGELQPRPPHWTYRRKPSPVTRGGGRAADTTTTAVHLEETASQGTKGSPSSQDSWSKQLLHSVKVVSWWRGWRQAKTLTRTRPAQVVHSRKPVCGPKCLQVWPGFLRTTGRKMTGAGSRHKRHTLQISGVTKLLGACIRGWAQKNTPSIGTGRREWQGGRVIRAAPGREKTLVEG